MMNCLFEDTVEQQKLPPISVILFHLFVSPESLMSEEESGCVIII